LAGTARIAKDLAIAENLEALRFNQGTKLAGLQASLLW
jgi:hypothetical protein